MPEVGTTPSTPETARHNLSVFMHAWIYCFLSVSLFWLMPYNGANVTQSDKRVLGTYCNFESLWLSLCMSYSSQWYLHTIFMHCRWIRLWKKDRAILLICYITFWCLFSCRDNFFCMENIWTHAGKHTLRSTKIDII